MSNFKFTATLSLSVITAYTSTSTSCDDLLLLQLLLLRQILFEANRRRKSHVVSTPEAIAKWREQRRRNFPTAANIERKKVEAQKRKSRGELETKPEPRPRLKKPSVASAGLLRKMLQGEIRKEHTLVLQCLRFISEESFFQDGGSVKA